jgi:predicted histidine transporter YuiF (NhaC family)
MTIQFWSNEPTILFNKEYIFELWPTTEMCYEQKLNAITRLVILLTILGYILTMSLRVLGVGAFTLLIIFVLFTMRKQKVTKQMMEEGFRMQDNIGAPMPAESYINPVTLESVIKSDLKEGNKKNPFRNFLLSQIGDNPE